MRGSEGTPPENRDDGDVDRRSEDRISGFEWVVAGLGLLFVVGTISFLVVDASRNEQTPPDIVVRADSVIALRSGGYLVRFSAENTGSETAADVSIVGELGSEGAIASSEATVDFLPGHSVRRGGLFFRVDPRGAPLVLRAEGFQDP